MMLLQRHSAVVVGAALVATVTASLVLSADAFLSPSFSARTTTTLPASSVFGQLQGTPLVRASDSLKVFLPDLWRSSTPFGMADEVAVCAFLRHYG